MSTKLPTPEKFLTWRVPTECEGPRGEKEVRLLVPRSNPYEHEHPFDLLFDEEGQAHQALVDYEVLEEAKAEGWVLCESLVTPFYKCGHKMVVDSSD